MDKLVKELMLIPGNTNIYMTVLGVSILTLSAILIFDFGIIQTKWYFFVFRLIIKQWYVKMYTLCDYRCIIALLFMYDI
jgi:hypothetical protein